MWRSKLSTLLVVACSMGTAGGVSSSFHFPHGSHNLQSYLTVLYGWWIVEPDVIRGGGYWGGGARGGKTSCLLLHGHLPLMRSRWSSLLPPPPGRMIRSRSFCQDHRTDPIWGSGPVGLGPFLRNHYFSLMQTLTDWLLTGWVKRQSAHMKNLFYIASKNAISLN